MHDLMVAFYAALVAIEQGQANEVELERCVSNGEAEDRLSIVIRREVSDLIVN